MGHSPSGLFGSRTCWAGFPAARAVHTCVDDTTVGRILNPSVAAGRIENPSHGRVRYPSANRSRRSACACLTRTWGRSRSRRFRERPELHKVLLVALTGWGQVENGRRTKEARFDAHELKPVSPEALEGCWATRNWLGENDADLRAHVRAHKMTTCTGGLVLEGG